jgi:Family of unknown function (DUF6350)
MVDLLNRTGPPSAVEDRAPVPVWLAGMAAGVMLAAAGVLAAMGLAVVGWMSGDGGSIGGALRVGADAWLLGHGSRLQLAEGTIGIVPLGVTAVVGWLSLRGGRWAATVAEAGRPLDAVNAAATFACAYTATVLAVVLVAADPTADPSLLRPLAVAAVLTFGAAVVGALRVADRDDLLGERVPEELRALWSGLVAGGIALLAAALVAALVSLAVHLGALREMLAALDPGVVGGLLLLLVCVLVLPNAVLFGVAVLLGPGVSIGAGTSVTLSEVSVGPMPAVPWFAAVPSSGSQPAALSALAAVPLLCGMVAGVRAVRRYPVLGYDRAALRGVLSGVGCGLVLAALVALSGGAIGPGRMTEVGPDVWPCAAVAVAALGVGGLVGGLGVHVVGRRPETRSDD